MKKIITNIIKNIYLILIFLILIVGILSGLKNDLLLFIISLLLITFLFFIEKKYSIIKHILKNYTQVLPFRDIHQYNILYFEIYKKIVQLAK